VGEAIGVGEIEGIGEAVGEGDIDGFGDAVGRGAACLSTSPLFQISFFPTFLQV
jgi:hypothetical protein